MLTLATTETLRGKAGTGGVVTYTVSGDAKGTSDAFQTLAQGVLGTSAATPLYTVPGSTQALVGNLHLANTSASPVTGVVIYIGGTAAGNQIWSGTIPANGTATYTNDGWKVYDSAGVQQYVGSIGPTGAPGSTGATGPTGPTGPAGVIAGLANVGAVPNAKAAALDGSNNLVLEPASTAFPGLMTATHYAQAIAQTMYFIFVTANPYQNLVCNGLTDDLANLNALYAAAPDGSTLVWPGQNSTMVLSGVATVPAGKHFIHVGGGPGNKTNVLQTSLTADHFGIASDWYSTWTGFNFTTNNTSATGVQALTSGTVLNIAAINTSLVPASGSINIGSAIGWQVLTYSARTSTTITLSSTGTGNSIAGIPIVFKTAGAAINAGNLVGIDAISNTFSYVFNGYVCSGSTANQSRIVGNGFLNTINFDVWIDGANWNGIIDSNTMDCTTNSRSVSHCEITQCGSLTGQGNQFIRGQYNLRIGSTTAAYPAGAFGVYFSNCFFDNAGIDAIKFQGISAIQRVKITSSWVSSAAAKGVNFASTASTLPSDIEFLGCNVYANGTDGFGGSGVMDYKVIGGQVAANVTGFNVTANAGGTYSVFAQSVRIGPTGGFGANTTGIAIATGTYAKVKFNNCDVTGNTTALTLGTVTITGALWSRFALADNPGINPRGSVGVVALPAINTAVTNTTGFRCTVYAKSPAAATTVYTVNGVVTTAAIAAQITPIPLDPGGTVAFSVLIVSWTWVAN